MVGRSSISNLANILDNKIQKFKKKIKDYENRNGYLDIVKSNFFNL